MMTNHAIRAQARELRQKQGLSIIKIATMLGVSKESVSLWVRDIELTPDQLEKLKRNEHRTTAQLKGAKANRDKAATKRIEYQQRGRERARQASPLYMAGCMLYWAEGAKDRNRMVFVNTDADMMRLFIRFLKEEMHVTDEKCVIGIHCYSSDEVEQRRIQQYWLDVFDLPETCLRGVLVRVGGETRNNKLEYGICRLEVYKTSLVQEIFGAVQEFAGFDRPEWLDMNKRDQHVT